MNNKQLTTTPVNKLWPEVFASVFIFTVDKQRETNKLNKQYEQPVGNKNTQQTWKNMDDQLEHDKR